MSQPPPTGTSSSSGSGRSPAPPLSPLTLTELVLTGIAVAGFAGRYFAGRIPTTNGPRTQLVHVLHQWALPAGITAACLAVGVAVLAAVLGHQHGAGTGGDPKRADALTGTLAGPLRIHPNALTVKRAKWAKGMLISGVVRYPADIPLPIQPETALPERLRPLAATDLAVTHDRARCLIHIAPAPPEPAPTPWWERSDDEKASPTLGALHTALAGFLDGLTIERGETTLADDGTPAKVTLAYSASTTKPTSERFRARIKQVTDQMVPAPTGAWNYIWLPHRSRLVLTPGTPLPESLPVALPPADLPRHSLPLGQRTTGGLGLWRPSRNPHLLVAGATGGGKSALIRTILLMAVLCGWDVYLADPKKLGYRGFAAWLGLDQSRVATKGQTMEAMILAVTVEMRRRYELCEWGHARPTDFRPLLLVMDENTEAIAAMNTHAKAQYAEETGKKPPKNHTSHAVDALWEIARLGREAGTYAVYAHQRPDVTYIPGEARDNLLSRYAAGALNGDGAEMMFDSQAIEQRVTISEANPDTGELHHRPVDGRATVQLGNGPEPLQGYWTPKIWDEQECPEGSADATNMAPLQPAAQHAWHNADPGLLPGVLQIRDGDGTILGATGGTPAHTLYATGQASIDSGLDASTDDIEDEPASDEPDDTMTGDSPAVDLTKTPEEPLDRADGPAVAQVIPLTPHSAPGNPPSTDPPADAAQQNHPAETPPTTGDLLTRAAEVVITTQNASAAALARELHTRQATTAELLTALQDAGIVGPPAPGKPRPVHFTAEALHGARQQLTGHAEHTEGSETP